MEASTSTLEKPELLVTDIPIDDIFVEGNADELITYTGKAGAQIAHAMVSVRASHSSDGQLLTDLDEKAVDLSRELGYPLWDELLECLRDMWQFGEVNVLELPVGGMSALIVFRCSWR